MKQTYQKLQIAIHYLPNDDIVCNSNYGNDVDWNGEVPENWDNGTGEA